MKPQTDKVILQTAKGLALRSVTSVSPTNSPPAQAFKAYAFMATALLAVLAMSGPVRDDLRTLLEVSDAGGNPAFNQAARWALGIGDHGQWLKYDEMFTQARHFATLTSASGSNPENN